MTKESAKMYSKEVRDILKSNSENVNKVNIEYDYSLVENSFCRDVVNAYEFETSNSGSEVPKYDDYSHIKLTTGTYIDNANYFTSAPQHGTNSSGTCGAVAAQLMLSYNNYYNDKDT